MIVQDRDRIREEVIALRNELNMIKSANQGSAVAITDTEVMSLRVAMGQPTKKNELAEHDTEISALKYLNIIDHTDITDLLSLRTAIGQLAKEKKGCRN